jgi:hypothetical protein
MTKELPIRKSSRGFILQEGKFSKKIPKRKVTQFQNSENWVIAYALIHANE